MNAIYVRNLTIEYTKKQLKLYGIRRVRLDDIARELGISKRTIYELFVSKEKLVELCLRVFARNGRELLLPNSCEAVSLPLQGVLQVVNAYITMLYQVERLLLSDMRLNGACQLGIEHEKKFWHGQLVQALEVCDFCPVVESTPAQMAHDMLCFFYSNCMNGYLYTSQLQMAYLLLRGLIECEEIGSMDEQIKNEWNRLFTILQNWENQDSLFKQ